MKRFIAVLPAALGIIACCGCGDTPLQSTGVRLTAPPVPAPPPAGDPAVKPAKPGSEAPTQLRGPQLKVLMGNVSSVRNTPPADAPAGDAPSAAAPTADAPTGGTPPPAATVADAGTPTPPASAPQFPAVVPSAPTVKPPVDKSQPAVPPDAVVAQPGVGAQGKGYGNGDAGLYTVPISTYFTVREQIAFQQVERAMNVFKTFNGRNPKSHEEFMKEIIKENAIKLPELPEGATYVYDPASGELKVAPPKKK